MTLASKDDMRFWDKAAKKYSKSAIADEDAYNQKLDMTREYFTPESIVFEFGCGTGSTALLHAPFVKQIDAVDLSNEMIAIAKGKAKDAGIENVIFSQADIASFSENNGFYDAVLGLSILHLLRDRKTTLAKIYDLLKPGGVFVSSTVCLTDMGFWRSVLPLARALKLAPHVAVLSPEELIAEQIEAGLEIVHQWQPKKGAAMFLIARKPEA